MNLCAAQYNTRLSENMRVKYKEIRKGCLSICNQDTNSKPLQASDVVFEAPPINRPNRPPKCRYRPNTVYVLLVWPNGAVLWHRAEMIRYARINRKKGMYVLARKHVAKNQSKGSGQMAED
jgi:hypothetical protein